MNDYNNLTPAELEAEGFHPNQYAIDAKVKQLADLAKEKYGEERVLGAYLYGSQNYGADAHDSDVDVKVLILPTIDDLVTGHEVSKILVLPGVGAADVKDVRKIYVNFMKANINFIELFYTCAYSVHMNCLSYHMSVMDAKYSSLADEVVRTQAYSIMRAAAGMAKQKYDRIFNKNIEAYNANFGYSPKDLAHLYRLKCFMEKFTEGEPFGTAIKLTGSERNTFFDYKHHSHSICVDRLSVMILQAVDLLLTNTSRADDHDGKNKLYDTFQSLGRSAVRAAVHHYEFVKGLNKE